MGRGDRNKVRWSKDRIRSKKDREKRKALARGQERKASK